MSMGHDDADTVLALKTENGESRSRTRSGGEGCFYEGNYCCVWNFIHPTYLALVSHPTMVVPKGGINTCAARWLVMEPKHEQLG